ncbi:type II toxin-antitoxin system PemK/MazF family toxin [Pseudarthrobacter sp. NPDC058362]|uniref:type II toxin-antitoxin system PemK/MazF family toxin n=1 Tax=Pseudarthrobacter sp. NPDC058362 TaxID=3346458 RepID=UPI00365C1056
MAINLRSLAGAVRAGLRSLRRQAATTAASLPSTSYPGDFHGSATIRYTPTPDGDPDPGEVVWAWVPYEEDPNRGKDRPVLLVGRHGRYLLGLMLTSRDRVPAPPPAGMPPRPREGSGDYVELGPGAWDRQGRPSEVRVDRVLQIRPDSVRREGAVLDRKRFDAVASALVQRQGWTRHP